MLKEIEKIRLNHSSDVEELVYLRWVNACLRYELRNYQPPQGKTVARDLSKCLSPRSEEKAKQLILEYADSHADENAMNPIALDDHSSSHVSTGDPDAAFMEIRSTLKHTSNKMKFFSKLKKLILGKDHRCSKVYSVDGIPTSCNSDHRVSYSNSSVDDMFGRDSYDGFSSTTVEEIGMADQTPAIELNSRVYSNEENDMAEKIELRKYAEVFKGSLGTKTIMRKSTSFS